jgi:hypothetical protein
MGFLRRNIGMLIVGALVVGAISYAGASALTGPGEGALLTQSGEGTEGDSNAEPKARAGRLGGPRGLKRAIRGEAVVPKREGEGFNKVKFDRGVLERVDGSTLVIKEDDGATVEVPTSDETEIHRDGEAAELGDLRAGDHVSANQVDEGDGYVTRFVRAVSTERFAELEQKREECKENPMQCRRERMQRRRERRMDRAA